MGNTFETDKRVKGLTDAENFKNFGDVLRKPRKFAEIVTGYVDLIRRAFPSHSQVESIIPLEHTGVDSSGLPLLTDFMNDLHADSLAVIACHDEDGSLIGLEVMKDGKYVGGLFYDPHARGDSRLFVRIADVYSEVLKSTNDRMQKEFTGIGGDQRQLHAAYTLFTFIVAQTRQQVEERITGARQ